MLTTISYSESDIVALREMAELQYHTAYEKAVNETVTVDENTYNFDEIFMENCIYAGYSMDEAIDAAMQKHKLLNSQEMKLVKRLATQTRQAVKRGDYDTAITLANKRLAHLENMVRRAEDIDDDEQFIIATETMIKSYFITIVATHILGFIINGLLPGSGPLVMAIKKGIDAFKLTNLKAGLAGKGFGAVVTFIAGKFFTISGAAKLTGSYLSAHKQRKWKRTRDGDVNREVNEGRPDTTHMSISRTQAKTKLNKLIQAQKEEIKTLQEYQKLQAQKEKAANKLATVSESAEVLDEGIIDGLKKHIEKRLAKAHNTSSNSSYGKALRNIETALNIKNGKPDKRDPSLYALAYVQCPVDVLEKYFQERADKHESVFKNFLDRLKEEVSDSIDENPKSAEKLNDSRKTIESFINDAINHRVFFYIEYFPSIDYYDAQTRKYVTIDYLEGDAYIEMHSVGEILRNYQESYNKHKNSDEFKYYPKALQAIKRGLLESVEVLDEKFFGKRKADTGKKPPEKKVNNAPVNVQELNRAKQEIQVALNLKNGKSVSSIPDLHVIAFVNCPPNVLEKYMQDNANKNSKIIENQIDDMIDYVDRYSSGRGIKDSDPKKYGEMQKDCKDAEERLRKMVNHKLFFFDTDADPETPLCFYDADIRKWVESSYLDGEAYVTEESVAGMLKKQEKRLRSSYMQSKVSLYQKALQEIKTELSESANILDEKIFRSPMLDMIKKRKEKKAKLAADREAACKRAKTEVSVALSIKNGKMPDTTPHPAALAFVKCPPDIVEKYAQAKAKKNPKVIEDQIDGMNEYIEMYYDDNDTKEYEPEKYAKLEKDRKYVEDYLKKAMTHRVFFFDTYSDRVSPLCYYDADTKTWVETGYYEAEAYVNEFYLSEMLKEEEKALRESFMQDRVSLYRRALQSLKNQLSESVGVLDEKFFKPSPKKPANAEVKRYNTMNSGKLSKVVSQDINAAINIRNGKPESHTPNILALVYVKCTPDAVDKFLQDNASKNPKAIEEEISSISNFASVSIRYESDDSERKKVEEQKNHVVDYLKKIMNHRLFFFAMRRDDEEPLNFYDADAKKWIEVGYDDYAYVTESTLDEHLKEQEKFLNSSLGKSVARDYQKALQSMKNELSESVTLNEAKLKAAERNELPDSAFGIPSKRKFPLNDPAHVKAAVKMFRHASPADRPELARRIKRAIKKFNLDIEIGEDNPLHEYK